MTKERYLEVRDIREIPIEDWFDFYKERGGAIEDIEEFKETFYTLLANEAIVANAKGAKQITFKSALGNFYKYYNTKFEL